MLQFVPSCDVSTQLFSIADTTSLGIQFANSFQQLNIDDMNVDHFILLSYEPQKPLTMSSVSGQATRYTNPSYWAGRSLPFGLLTMSVVRWSNKKYLNPSYLAGWPLGHEWSHISRKKLYC